MKILWGGCLKDKGGSQVKKLMICIMALLIIFSTVSACTRENTDKNGNISLKNPSESG